MAGKFSFKNTICGKDRKNKLSSINNSVDHGVSWHVGLIELKCWWRKKHSDSFYIEKKTYFIICNAYLELSNFLFWELAKNESTYNLHCVAIIFNIYVNYFYQLKYSGKAITFARGLNFDLQAIATYDFMSCHKYFSVYSHWVNI